MVETLDEYGEVVPIHAQLLFAILNQSALIHYALGPIIDNHAMHNKN